MARTYTTVGWEDGTVLQPAKVTVQGTEYNVENEVVTGRTPINAQNLRKMDNEIKRIVEEDIPSVYDEKLLTISDTAPSECIEGDKYYNTTDNKIYTAVATDTWSQDGDTPIEGKLYIVFNEQSTYAYNGTTLVSVGGGSGSSDIVVVPTETPTEETKIEIEDEDFDFNGSEITDEYSESTEVGYSANYSNGHFQTKGTILYNNNSGTTNDITLNNDDFSNYTKIEILTKHWYFNAYQTFTILNPNGKTHNLDMSLMQSDGVLYITSTAITINNANLSYTFAGAINTSQALPVGTGKIPNDPNVRQKIYKIIGYKEV